MSNFFILLQALSLFVLSFILAQLDSESVYFLAVILGSTSGSLILLRFRSERSLKRTIIQVLSGILVGTILSIVITEYYQIINWKYLLGISGLMGLTGLMVAKSLVVVFNEDLLVRIIKNRISLPNDKSNTPTERSDTDNREI